LLGREVVTEPAESQDGCNQERRSLAAKHA